MASASRLNYHWLVESTDPARGCGCLVLVPGLAGGMNGGQWPKDAMAKGRDAIDAWTEAANDLGSGPGRPMPSPAQRMVLDAA